MFITKPFRLIGTGAKKIVSPITNLVHTAKDIHDVSNYVDNIKKEVEVSSAKSIFTSKTFWLNVIGLGLTISGYLPPQYAVPVMAVLNIANRFLTTGPVSLMGDVKTS